MPRSYYADYLTDMTMKRNLLCDGLASVGFAEIDLGVGPAAEVVRLPVDGSAEGDIPIAWLMTRERVDPMDRWRSDPEPSLIREFATASDLVARPEYAVRVDARAPDTVLAGVFAVMVVRRVRRPARYCTR